jgi:hypothetical protein
MEICSIPFGVSEFLEECLSCERKLLYLKEQDMLIEDEIQEDKLDEEVLEMDGMM